MNLRDHDRDCVHGFHVSHNHMPSRFLGVEDVGPIGWCPGGAAVVLGDVGTMTWHGGQEFPVYRIMSDQEGGGPPT